MSRGNAFALTATLLVAATALAVAPSAASAAFGFLPGAEGFSLTATEAGGAPDTQAGSHPYQLTTKISFNLAAESVPASGAHFTDGDLKNLDLELPAGLIEDPSAVPTCSQTDFNTPRESPYESSASGESCPLNSQIGIATADTSVAGGSSRTFGVFNLEPPPGAPAQVGFSPYGVPIALTPQIRQAGGEYGLTLQLEDFSQRFDLLGLEITIWGTPWNITHDTERGNCLDETDPGDPYAKCSVGRPASHLPQAYLTLPTSCAGPLNAGARAQSWQQQATAGAVSSLPALDGCELIDPAFDEVASAEPTATSAATPSGLDFNLELPAEGLTEPEKLAPSEVQTAELTLPAGLTINPSVGDGLGVCTTAQYEAEAAATLPGSGCPNASKIGDVSVQSPLFEAALGGSLFLAQPFQNPTDSLIGLYLVAKSPQRGVIVKVAGEVRADPESGRLTATFEDLPQLPYTHLKVHFREGHRAPLVTPPTCGPYSTQTVLAPWPDPTAVRQDGSSFTLTTGIGGGTCPTGTPAFHPAAQGGTANAYAGAYSPFYLHLTRIDSEQEITSYSAQLPPGLLANLSGIPFCPDAAIEAAKGRSGVSEEEAPSCPVASEIGHTEAGYGVGGVLAYAPGRLYLSGPYHGSPLSIVAIDAATVGPFDLGTIVIRSAIEIDPEDARVSIDSAASDPIPHIRDGIPLHLRDIRVYLDRPDFMVNPTSCDPFSLTSTLTGSAAPFTDPEDATATATDPFHVLFCSSLPFKPRFALRLGGGTRRGAYPSLRATFTPRPGEANTSSAAVALPPTEFLAEEHIQTVCTRPQFAAETCPPGSLYGHASAITPLLEVPLQGPVYLRSSSHSVPDLVADLHGRGIRIILDGRIDSHHAGIRATFEDLPDAPVTKFTMNLEGGKHGLLVNAANLCVATRPATARFLGQNNTGAALKPHLLVSCRGSGVMAKPHHGKKR